MNKTAIILTVFLALGSLPALNAQSDFDPLQEDFFAYKARKMAYFDSVRVARNGDMKGVGYTPFMRWVQRWQPLVINDGGFLASMEAKVAGRKVWSAARGGGNKKAGMMTNHWTEIGPTGPTVVPSTSQGTRIQGAGRLHFLEFDDVNGRVLCGSPAGGLFFSEDDGQTWQNGGMDYLPEIGASHAQVAKNVNQGMTWFVATGDGEAGTGEGGLGNFSNGVWRTTDKGAT